MQRNSRHTPRPVLAPSLASFVRIAGIAGVLCAAPAARASEMSESERQTIQIIMLSPLWVPSFFAILFSAVLLTVHRDAEISAVTSKNARRLAAACLMLAAFGFIIAASMRLLPGVCAALALVLLGVAYLDFSLSQRPIRNG